MYISRKIEIVHIPRDLWGEGVEQEMSSFVGGVLVSDQWLQSQFTQVELRSLKAKVISFLSPLLYSNFVLLLNLGIVNS